MYRSCVDPALDVLKRVLELPQYAAKLQTPIQAMDMDLKFFKMFFWALAYLEDSSEDDWRLRGSWSTMMAKFMQTAEDFAMRLEYAERKITGWEALSGPLRRLITLCKAQVKEICTLLLKGDFAYRVCQSEKDAVVDYGEDTMCFIRLVLQNVRALDLDSDLIERRLGVFEMFALVAKDSPDVAVAARVVSHVQTWAIQVSCFACLYWLDGYDDVEDVREAMFSDLMGRYMPYTPDVISMYLELLKGSRYYDFQSRVIIQLLVTYVDFLLENLVLIGENDIELLRQGMVILLSFVMDPVKEDSEKRKLILAQIYGILSEVPLVICTPQTKLLDLLDVIDKGKIQLRELYVLKPLEFPLNSAKTNAVGFLDCFVANLKKMLEGRVDFLPFVKHQVEIVREQLILIRPFLQITELQTEHERWIDLRTRVVDVVYYAAYVANLCPLTSRSLWYGILCLPYVIKDIKLVKSEVEHDRLYIIKNAIAEMESSDYLESAASDSKDEVPRIGYQQEAEDIIYHLTQGPHRLRIISISGMAGQGKTTLAKRVYYDHSVQFHFHVSAWCYVSKESSGRQILANILCQLCGKDCDRLDGGKDYDRLDDLSDMVYKCLKGRRYLIVLDNICDVSLWYQVKLSFPDDTNRSRILLTTQNHDLALLSMSYTISHRLRLFSDEESWELMKYKLSNCDDLPHQFIETGKLIACNCNGLPLTVTKIASLLRKTGPVLDLWKEIAEYLISEPDVAIPESMDLIELSYKYLPENLKSCFLYMVGAFGSGEDISVKKLKLLWIAEGFVKENGKQSEDLAKDYLNNLISRNLVVVVERNSMGGIKRCKLPDDRLYDLCFAKSVQDNFWVDKSTFYGSQRYDFHHRLCIDENDPCIMPEYTCNHAQLPTSLIHSLLWNGYDSVENYNMAWLSRFRVLTVLDLGFLHLTNFPEVILYNIHLTYLAIGGDIKDIPHSIGDLWNLETLIVRGVDVVRIPEILWEMESLKHVHIDRIHLHLKDLLPNDLSMAAARNIKVLGDIILKYDLKTMEFVRRLSRLKKLKSGCDDKVIHRLWFSIFGSLENLESLHLYYSGGGGLLSNRQLPTVNFPNNLRKLTVRSFKLPWSVMSIIGKLPNLKVLKLHHWACMEESTWYLADGDFIKLNYLKLYRMDVEVIDDSKCRNPFPCLESLFLLDCWKLREIPSRFEGICTLDGNYAVAGSSSHPIVTYSMRQISQEEEQKRFHDICTSDASFEFEHSALVNPFLEPWQEMRSCNIHDLLHDLRLKATLRGSFLNIVPHAHHLPLSYKCLTELNLERVYIPIFAEEILYLCHLRSLSLCGNFEYIPMLIINLENLETLMVRSGLPVIQIPDTLWDMRSLTYVVITKSVLNWADFSGKKSSVAVASNIEVLRGIILGLGYDDIVSRLIRLKELQCYCDISKIHSSWFSMFTSLEKLESLSVIALGQSFAGQILAHTFTLPYNLLKLSLTESRLPWSAMSTIGMLPCLEVLELHSEACEGSTWHLGDGEFRRLSYLKLKMMNVEEIYDSGCEDLFPCLESLILLECWKLTEIPSSFGNIYTLKTIHVSLCHPDLSNLVRIILEEQRDFGNDKLRVYGL